MTDNTPKIKTKEAIEMKTGRLSLNWDGKVELPNIYDEVLLSRDHPKDT